MLFRKILLISCAAIFCATMPLLPACAQKAKQTDIVKLLTHFENHEEYVRKKTGFQVIGFLIIFAFIVRRVEQNIWKDVKKKNNKK